MLDLENTIKAKVRVLIESTDYIDKLGTVEMSRDVIQTSMIALVDSIEYKLIKDIEKSESIFLRR